MTWAALSAKAHFTRSVGVAPIEGTAGSDVAPHSEVRIRENIDAGRRPRRHRGLIALDAGSRLGARPDLLLARNFDSNFLKQIS